MWGLKKGGLKTPQSLLYLWKFSNFSCINVQQIFQAFNLQDSENVNFHTTLASILIAFIEKIFGGPYSATWKCLLKYFNGEYYH